MLTAAAAAFTLAESPDKVMDNGETLKMECNLPPKQKKIAVNLGKQGRPVTDPPLVVHLRGNFRSKKSQTEM